jgi:hypothetical protein
MLHLMTPNLFIFSSTGQYLNCYNSSSDFQKTRYVYILCNGTHWYNIDIGDFDIPG